MPTKTNELATTTREGIMKLKTSWTTYGSSTRHSIKRSDDRWLSILRSNSPSDDAHDARMPSFPRQNNRGICSPTSTFDVLFRLLNHVFLDRTTLQGELFEVRGDSVCARNISFEQESEREIRIGKSSWSIQSWSDPKRDVICSHAVHEVEFPEVGESAESRSLTEGNSGESGAYEGSIVTNEGSYIRDCSNRDEIQPHAHVEFGPKSTTNSSTKRESQSA